MCAGFFLLGFSLNNNLLTRRDRCATGGESSTGESRQQICLWKIDFIYIECFGCLSISSACHPTSLQIMSDIILLWIMYFSSGCCRGDTAWLCPFPPTLNLFPLFSRSALNLGAGCISLQPRSSNAARFYPFPINLHALLCQVTLMSHSFADLRHGERETSRWAE